MAVTMPDAIKDNILDWLCNGTALGSGSRYLALDTDASATECTGGTYARADLAAKVPAASGGAIASDTSVTFDIGTDVATYWRIMSSSSGAGTEYARGPLSTSKTGSFTIAVGDITGTVRAV